MANPTLVPFKADHLLMFRHRDQDYIESIRSAYAKEKDGPAFSAVLDGRVIGSAGVVIAWPGFGVAWAVFTVEIFRYPVWVTRTVRVALRDIIRAHTLYRVEAVAIAHAREGWLEALGFNRENGVARCYTHAGADVVRYELVTKL